MTNREQKIAELEHAAAAAWTVESAGEIGRQAAALQEQVKRFSPDWYRLATVGDRLAKRQIALTRNRNSAAAE